jgi:hypothetical protein
MCDIPMHGFFTVFKFLKTGKKHGRIPKVNNQLKPQYQDRFHKKNFEMW